MQEPVRRRISLLAKLGHLTALLTPRHLGLVVVVPVCACVAPGVLATTYTPNIFTDPNYTSVNNTTGVITGGAGAGSISLRSALQAADNNGVGPHTITLSAGTYQITGGSNVGTYVIFGSTNNQNITINGVAGSPLTTIINMSAGAFQDRIFAINVATLGGTLNVQTTINSVRFTNGHLNSDPYGGGAIEFASSGNSSALTLANCEFIGNTIDVNAGTTGGAVNYSGSGTLTVTGTTFTNNSNANSDGGALYYFFNNLSPTNTGVMNVSGNTFSGNTVTTASAQGGALGIALQGRNSVNQNFTGNITKNTFVSNTAPSGNGGAIIANNGDAAYVININDNRFLNNSTTSTTAVTSGMGMNSASGSVNVTDNWWGCDTGPTVAGSCNRAAIVGSGGAGTLNASTWLQLRTTASPNSIVTNQTTTLTSSFLANSSGTAVAVGNLSTLIGLPVTWSSVGGGLSAQQGTIQAAGTATATYSETSGVAGTHSATAVVDNGPASGSLNTAAITVSKANTTAAITSSLTTATVTGQAYTVAYTVTGAFGNSPTAPTGNVQVSDGTSTCTATVAVGSCSLTSTTAGAKTITATYLAGDANFNASAASAGVAHTVNKADTTTNITADNPDASVVNQAVTIQFNVAANIPGGGTPTGNVTVTDGTNSCTATNAVGQCTITYATPGPRTLTATYVGDTNYNASPVSSGASHTVNQANTTAAVTTHTPNPSVAGQSVAVAFTVTGSSGNSPTVPTGNVTISDGVDSCIGTVAAGTCNITLTTAGSRNLTATYAGDTNFLASPASASVSHTVSNTAVWNGSTSSNWNTPANWTTNFVPTATNTVSIPSAGVTNQPNLSTIDVTIAGLTISSGESLTISGGHTFKINGSLVMNGNNIDATAGILEIGTGGTITRTSGTVLGPLKKDFLNGLLTEGAEDASSPDAPTVTTFTYPVGTAAGMFEVQVTPTAASNGTLTIQNFDGNPAPTSAASTLQRFWTTSSTGTVQADVKFNFHATATPGAVANYTELRVVGGVVQSFPNGAPCPGAGSPCFDNTAKTIFVAGVTSFNANWTAGVPLGTTAAHVAVSGRVVSADGIALRGARVTLDDGTGHPMTAVTNAFGYYHFDAVQSGSTYMLNASARGYTFSPRVVPVTDQLSDLDLTALP